MINPTGKKLEKLLFGMFDDAIKGVDTYNHNGSLWLIFTDEMRWIVEYTKSQTLWYNYYFFKNEMEIIGLDCVDDKDLIQKWFESRFLNMGEVKVIDDYIGQDTVQVKDTIQNGVKDITFVWDNPKKQIKDTIQNGVKNTNSLNLPLMNTIEDTIQNGVKGTTGTKYRNRHFVEETIQNGVKDTHYSSMISSPNVEDTIQNGVKHTNLGANPAIAQVEDIIQNGVKQTSFVAYGLGTTVEDIIQNGVKDTKEMNHDRHSYHGYFKLENDIPTHIPMDQVQDVIQNGVKHCEDGDWLNGDERFEDIIQNGVKEMQPLPAQDGNRDWGKYYHGKEDRTKPHTEYVKDVIKIGEKLNQDGI